MSDLEAIRASSLRILLYLQFARATVIYTDNFDVLVDGPMWPREVEATMKILSLYKEQHKESNREHKEKAL